SRTPSLSLHDALPIYQTGPFTFGESGQPVTVQGSAFLVVHFPHASGVDLTNPSADPTYTGPASIIPSGLAHVREVRARVRQVDRSEEHTSELQSLRHL